MDEMINKLKNDNNKLEEKIREKRTQLKVYDDRKKVIITDKLKAQKEITAELLKKTSKYFETHDDDGLVYLFEALVGMMRGQNLSDNYSVELYLKTIEGFNIALTRADPRNIDPDVAQTHLNKIQTFNELFFDPKFNDFQPFKTLMTRLCMLSLLAKDEVVLEKSIDEKKDLIQRNLKEIE
jgi:hypothetical protein